MRRLPGAFDAERGEFGLFGLVQPVLYQVVHAGSAWSAAETGAQLVQVFGGAGGNNFHVAIFSVADPAPQFQLAGLALDEPAETNPLNAAADKEMKHHTLPV
jgi:hypothetical protein